MSFNLDLHLTEADKAVVAKLLAILPKKPQPQPPPKKGGKK